MKKVEAINEKNYFKESEKAFQLVEQREDYLHRSLSEIFKLRLATEAQKKAKTREEYNELQDTIKDLEFEIKYDKGYIEAIPDEHKEVVAQNRIIEDDELQSELKKQKEMLVQLLDGLQHPLLTVLENIQKLEKRRLLAKKIDILLVGKLYKDPTHTSALWHTSYLGFSGEERAAKNALEKGKMFFHSLQAIATSKPIDNGIPKTPFLKKLFGGVSK